jgi:gamma-glutamyltranspeptidase/glutathione hydrolase
MISNIRRIFFAITIAAMLTQTWTSFPQAALSEPASSGMVSSAHPLATQAGVDILAAGGNAFDAAVAIAATLNVVEPMMSGIGGYGTIMTFDAERNESKFLNCSGRIPSGVDSDAFRAPTPNYLANRSGAKAVSTPGNVACWDEMSRKYGKLNWNQLFGSAIKHAADGFVVGDRNAAAIRNAFSSFPEHAKKFYGTNGEPLKATEKLIQKDLAKTFRAISALGLKHATEGELAKAIDAAMRDAKGFLAFKDLHRNKAEWWQPISIDYRGHKIVTASPPANSFDMLVRLGLMSRFDVASLGHNSVEFLHRFAEVTKIGFRVRLDHAADPDIKAVPLDRLLSEVYWKQEADNIDLQKARPFARTDDGSYKQTHTTHFVVADRWGNVVSATQTLGNLFGSRIMPPETGVWLNNSLEYSTFEPKGNPMDGFPSRHKLSGDCPTFIFRDGKLWSALGTPGGHTIGQTVPQMIMNLIDFRMDIQQAIAAPRISFIEPDELGVESTISESTRNKLAEMGHKIAVFRNLGNAHGLTIEYDKHGKPTLFRGGYDPRGDGAASGLK